MSLLGDSTDSNSVFKRKVRIIEALDLECEMITGKIVMIENEMQPILDTEVHLNVDMVKDPNNQAIDQQLLLIEQKVKEFEEIRDDAEAELASLEDAITSIRQTLSIDQQQLLKNQ